MSSVEVEIPKSRTNKDRATAEGGKVPGHWEVFDMLKSAQKTAAPGSPAYSVYVNRRLGRHVAAAAFRAGLTPSQVTAVSAVLSLSGIVLLAVAPPSWIVGIAVWLLLAIGYVFDSADGQVARLRGGGSFAGEWLDHVVDCAKIISLHAAVLWTVLTHFGLPDQWVLLPLGFAIVSVVSFFAMILNDQLKNAAASRGAAVSQTLASRKRSVILLSTDYGIFCFSFVLLGVPGAFIVVYALLFLANAIYLALALVKWFGDMHALDSAT
jgi:phosphatidylglycerophosphate synthase